MTRIFKYIWFHQCWLQAAKNTTRPTQKNIGMNVHVHCTLHAVIMVIHVVTRIFKNTYIWFSQYKLRIQGICSHIMKCSMYPSKYWWVPYSLLNIHYFVRIIRNDYTFLKSFNIDNYLLTFFITNRPDQADQFWPLANQTWNWLAKYASSITGKT